MRSPSPPVSGVWWTYTWLLYDSLSSPPVTGVCERIQLIGSWLSLMLHPVLVLLNFPWCSDSLSPPTPPVAILCVGERIRWSGSMNPRSSPTCSWCVLIAYHLIGSRTLLSSTPCAVCGTPSSLIVLWLRSSLLHLICVVSATTWLALFSSLSYSPPKLVCGECIHLIGSMTLSSLHL